MPDESFSPPKVMIGDQVYWYQDALSCSEPTLGWVATRPGVQTLTILTFSPNTGFIERPSVRHRDDPGLQEHSEWREWGAWDFSPSTAQSRKLDGLVSQIAHLTEQVAIARRQNGTKNG